MTRNQPAVAVLLAAVLLAATSGCGLLCPTPYGPWPVGGLPAGGMLSGPDEPIADQYGPQPFRTGVDMFLPHYHGIPYCGDGCADGCGSVYWHEWFSDPPSPCDPCGSAYGGPKWLYGECCLGDGHCCRHLSQILYGTFSTLADWDFGLGIVTPFHSAGYGRPSSHGCGHCGLAVPAGVDCCDQCLAGSPFGEETVEDEAVLDAGMSPGVEPTLAVPGVSPDPAAPPTVISAGHGEPIGTGFEHLHGSQPRTRPAHRVTTRHLGPLRSPPVRW